MAIYEPGLQAIAVPTVVVTEATQSREVFAAEAVQQILDDVMTVRGAIIGSLVVRTATTARLNGEVRDVPVLIANIPPSSPSTIFGGSEA